MKAWRTAIPTKILPLDAHPEAITQEMLKMKIDPAMFMKTKVSVTKCTPKNTAFYTKMHRLRDNFGEVGRLLIREEHIAQTGRGSGSLFHAGIASSADLVGT